jgi:AraC-like DNA-binding protein
LHEVPVSWFRHAAAMLGAESAALKAACQEAGLRRGVLEDGSERIPARQFVDFLEAAARLAGDDALGLTLGRSYDFRASGLVAFVSIASGSLGEAIRNAVRYAALNDTGGDYGFRMSNGAGRLRIDTRDAYARLHRHANEFKAALILAACRRWVDPGFRPLEMRFAHPRVSLRRSFVRFFGCPVAFGAEATEMLLSADQLELPVKGADPYLLALMRRHGDELVAAAARSRKDSLRSRVERLVLPRLPKGVPAAGEVAAALGLGERTFTRRLAAEGAPFRRLVDELRRDAAESYLRDDGLTLAQVAHLLGYAEQSAFTAAFRRWTGQSPGRFRATELSG